MNPQEIVRVQNYLRKVFGTKTLSVRARAKKDDSAEVYVGDEFIGILFREEEEGELFPEAEEVLGDAIDDLGDQMKERKGQLTASLPSTRA